MPVERPGARNDLADLYDLIKSGASNYEIMEQSPEYLLHTDKIERVRQIIKAEQFKEVFRELEVTYMWGKTGIGKTRHVMESIYIPSIVIKAKMLFYSMNFVVNSKSMICSTI
ncbi:hypothetical protein PAECIP111893_04011 [Paenibacillus plantiphilus]|uniref:IstB-like ATP binding protein n=1 Tax=Paenibacillus plantiphilus TaxID=2905650 RepID=A0ABN8GQX2_9BACL|nr:hypothetical protein [Paenibacillus plantiphilus]CAH1215710.1 hypothetical protein PAECIP111893_04011 [Paenibacillus plantiphilus]